MQKNVNFMMVWIIYYFVSSIILLFHIAFQEEKYIYFQQIFLLKFIGKFMKFLYLLFNIMKTLLITSVS